MKIFNKILSLLGKKASADARYACKGTCGVNLSEQEYQGHPTKVCGTEGCSGKGQPFAKK